MNYQYKNISTREEAIAILVEADVSRWGESERGASLRSHRSNYPTLGSALNAIAARAQLDDVESWPAWRRLADQHMTSKDRAKLRQES